MVTYTKAIHKAIEHKTTFGCAYFYDAAAFIPYLERKDASRHPILLRRSAALKANDSIFMEKFYDMTDLYVYFTRALQIQNSTLR